MSVGRVILMFRSLPATTLTSTCLFDQAGFIRSDKPVLAGFLKRLADKAVPKHLRCLCQNQSFAGQCLANFVQMNEFDGVHRHDSHNSGTGFPRFLNDPFNRRNVDEGAYGIVNGYQVRIRRRRRQRILDRLLA